jgi:hypothetical protein
MRDAGCGIGVGGFVLGTEYAVLGRSPVFQTSGRLARQACSPKKSEKSGQSWGIFWLDGASLRLGNKCALSIDKGYFATRALQNAREYCIEMGPHWNSALRCKMPADCATPVLQNSRSGQSAVQ